LLPFKEVISMGNPYIMTRTKNALIPEANPQATDALKKLSNLLSTEILTEDGSHFDFVKGFEFDPKSGAITKIETYNGGSIPGASIVFLSLSYVLIKSGSAQVEAPTPEPTAVVEPVAAEEEAAEEAAVEEIALEVDEAPEKEADVEEKDFSDDPLIGITVGEDVSSKDGEFFVAKGTEITEELLAEADRHDAILLLTMSVDI
jgi:hypothetical protein